MPVGFLITTGLVAVGMAASLWPSSRSALLGPATWVVTAIPNESPFLALYWKALHSQGFLLGRRPAIG